VEVSWVVTSCSVVIGYYTEDDPLKRWYSTTTLHEVTSQKTSTWNITAVKASNLVPNEHLAKEQIPSSEIDRHSAKQEFPAFNGNRWFVTVFTRARLGPYSEQ